jgi:hypothetical protein
VRVSQSVSTTLGRDGVQRIVSEIGEGKRTLQLRTGAISVPFDCRFNVGEAADGGLHLTGVGVAPGAGFTVDLAVSAGDESLEIEGEVLVSGSLAGLAQRELRFWAGRLLEEALAAR